MRAELGGLRLDRLIGRGGSAEVWLAWAPHRQAPVVVKRSVHAGRPGPAAVGLRAEAEALARVRHPAVVGLLEVVDDPPDVALVLPHLAGGSLRHLLAERGTLAPGELVAVLAAVAGASAGLASAGLVHGDLKPEHVCFDDAGVPVLVDLGSAWRVGAPAGMLGGSRTATPAYLDPAVADGAAPGPRSEVFALAVVAYESLTGRLPHRGDPAHALAAAAAGAHRSLRTWPAIPAAVADVVEQALDPDPARRPHHPLAFVEELGAAVPPSEVVLPGPAAAPLLAPTPAGGASTTLRYGPAPPPPAESRPAHRVPMAVVGAVAAACAAVAVGAAVAGIGGDHGDGRRPDAAASAPDPPACPLVLPLPPPGRLVEGDVDGDGCPDVGRWDGTALVVGVASGAVAFQVDAPGAELVLGDWDGDGADAPAIYDPATGATRLFDHLPAAVGEGLGPSRRLSLAPGGRPEVVRAPVGDPGSRAVDVVRVVRP